MDNSVVTAVITPQRVSVLAEELVVLIEELVGEGLEVFANFDVLVVVAVINDVVVETGDSGLRDDTWVEDVGGQNFTTSKVVTGGVPELSVKVVLDGYRQLPHVPSTRVVYVDTPADNSVVAVVIIPQCVSVVG